MASPSAGVTAALETLRTKWGTAAPARVGEVVGALATVPLEAPERGIEPDRSVVFSTGFEQLDAILGPGGVPRGLGISLRGDLSSGRTTLALRLAAEAQAGGAIVAWLDLAAAFDPVEAVARGVRLEWLAVITPHDPEEGVAIAGSLLSGRAVDLLVVDLPVRIEAASRVAERLGRLAALARRAGITVGFLEPPGLTSSVGAAIGEATGVRLELVRRAWIRLGRDVVGQRTEVVVARNRAGPPGGRAMLRILYADGGDRDRCLRRDDLLRDELRDERLDRSLTLLHRRPARPLTGQGGNAATEADLPADTRRRPDEIDASVPSAPSARSRPASPALRLVAGGPGGPRRQAVVARDGPRRGPARPVARGAARDDARRRAPALAGGDIPRARTGS